MSSEHLGQGSFFGSSFMLGLADEKNVWAMAAEPQRSVRGQRLNPTD